MDVANYISLFINIFAVGIKGCVLIYLYSSRHADSQKTIYLRRILSVGLFCSMVTDSAWVVVLLRRLSIMSLSPVVGWSWIRFGWLCGFVYAQSIAIFIQYITRKNVQFNSRYYVSFIPSVLVCCIYIAYVTVNYQNEYVSYFEHYLRLAGVLLGIFFLIFPSILYAERATQNSTFPRILGSQIRWAIVAFATPFIVTELVGLISISGLIFEGSHALISAITTFFLSLGIYVIGKKILRLRFLNLQKRVTSAPRATFIAEMKKISGELHAITSESELPYIVRAFFTSSFCIPTKKVHFYLNGSNTDHNNTERSDYLQFFFATEEKVALKRLQQHEILVLDELVFSNFYEDDPIQEKLIDLLRQIDADIVLPIFKKNAIIAYIVIDRHARKDQLYSNVESDEMVVFATIIGNIINVLHNAFQNQLNAKYHNLKEEVHHKHQEINHYKESLRTFLRHSQQRDIGVLFYKNRRFSFANRSAKNIIEIDLNKYPGNSVVKAITRIASSVEKYKDAQSSVITNSDGKRIVVSAVPSLNQNSVIITIHPPQISDLIRKQIDLLKEPQKWDYLLYLETTKAGRLINEALPGSSESILNFKVELLKAALCRQANLITAPSDDIAPLVTVLHQISMRDTLHVLTLHESGDTYDTAIKLFGANKLLYPNKEYTPPLLKTLDKVGTLHIENVQHLTMNAQNQLAEYILYGYFNPVRSEERIISDVRIVCSTDQNLPLLVEKGLFDSRLYTVLQKSSVHMPLLVNLDNDEFKELTESIATQSLPDTEFASLVSLSEYEKTRIINERPISFSQLQSKIKTILTQKSQKSSISYDSDFDEIGTSNPLVAQAIQLGKKALRSEKLMKVLWKKFKNQAKIANLLGVNRSSVLRRCQEYNLTAASDKSTPDITP